MSKKLTDTIVKNLPAPDSGNRVTYDAGEKAVKGFGVRVTAGGSRSFVLNYRTRSGRERRFTIGQFPTWKTGAAREEAAALKQRIRLSGEDPLAALEADRNAKTVANLAERFLGEHCERKNRASTTESYRRTLNKWVLPKLKHLKVTEVSYADIDCLHGAVTKAAGPYAANRTVAVLSKMFNQAIKWKWTIENPARGIERNAEPKRARYLDPEKGEFERLTKALEQHPDKQATNIVRLLLLTGARRGEVLNAKWGQFDLQKGTWTKPGATTKQKTEHHAPLSAPARRLLAEIFEGVPEGARRDEDWVFPGKVTGQPREGIKRAWEEIRQASGLPDLRIHDLRHSYASILASSGLSLSIIGQLLGHTQPATTARYAHLFDDPLRAATERVAAIIERGKGRSAEIVQIGSESSR
jgi:integrase